MPVSIGYNASPQRAAVARISVHAAGLFNAVRKWAADATHRWVERREAMMALRSIDDRTLKDIGVRRSAILSVLYGDRR